MPETKEIASRFVDLVMKYDYWEKIEQLPADEMQILFDVVFAAGFELKAIVLGKLRGNWHDQGGPTGETFPINELCPFKVVKEEGNHHFATGWLDCALRRVTHGATRERESRDQIIEAIHAEIERSVPLKPVQLTPEGDLLQEYPRKPNSFGFSHFVDHARDNHEFGSYASLHKYCYGGMNRRRATEKYDALVCGQCYLRVLFPKEVRTYGELRQALASQFAQTSV